VTDRDGIFALSDEIEAAGGCDVAIANAGVMQLGPLLTMEFADVERQFAVNVYGVIHVLQAFGRRMVQRGSGILMPVSSVVSIQSLPGYGAYCGTKFGVRALSDALAMELRGTGVKVVHVLPGATQSELHTHMDASELPKSTRQARRVPAEQVARAMVKAAKRPKAVVLCDWRARLLYWGKRMSPGLVNWTVKQVTKRG
jgi:short-subunit dehydrogenase